MAELAALNIKVDSESVKKASVELQTFGQKATAAEKAAERWGMSTNAAARSTEDFSKRVQGTIKALEFERQQLTRTSAEQAKYAALRRAGVSASSAEGQAIAASVAALQAQRAGIQANAKALTESSAAAKAGTAIYGSLKGTILSLAAAFSIDAIIGKVTDALREVADLGEMADQIGITVDGLQALQFQAVQNGISLDQLNTGIGKFSENIGKAADGDKAMLESLDRLNIKILDVRGNLLPTEDLLVQAAQRIMAIEDPAKRTAAAVELFGKAGKMLLPTLAQIAQGFDAMGNQAKAAGAIISAEAIAKLDALADSAAKSHLVMRAFFAETAAGPLTETIDWISGRIANLSAIIKNVKGDLLALLQLAANPLSIVPALLSDLPQAAIAKKVDAARSAVTDLQGNMAMAKSDRDRARMTAAIGKAQAELDALLRQQSVLAVGGKVTATPGDPDGIGIRVAPSPPKGVSNPIADAGKGARSGGAAQPKVIDEAAKAAEKLASWMRDANTSFDAFMANQEVARQSLFLSSEAASALRIETDFLNKAKADDVTLTEQQRAALRDHATAMAASEEKTRQLTEAFEFAKDITSGFFADFAQGLREGQSLFESFGNAAVNVLNKIADKLISMAVDDLVSQAFGGKGGSTGGFLSSILGMFSGGGGGLGGGSGMTFANGAAFRGGNVVPFARGGVVSRPTLFPMANGAGLMGEAGPEAVMPLKRRNGRLGVEASGGGGVVVNVINNADGTKATTRESKGPGGAMQIDVIVEAVEGKMAGRMSRGQGSLGKTIEGRYGVQPVGR